MIQYSDKHPDPEVKHWIGCEKCARRASFPTRAIGHAEACSKLLVSSAPRRLWCDNCSTELHPVGAELIETLIAKGLLALPVSLVPVGTGWETFRETGVFSGHGLMLKLDGVEYRIEITRTR